MKTRKRFHFLPLFFLLFLVPGCAHVISKNMRDAVDPALTFGEVFKNPDAYKGKLVLWGGEIIQTVALKDGRTEVEVFQRPLGGRGEPGETARSEGRFLVLADKYLDPYLFRRGRRITVAGEVLGEKKKPLDQMEYRYPLISSRELYLWGDYYYRPYPYYYYYPWWYHRPWGWGYPYWW